MSDAQRDPARQGLATGDRLLIMVIVLVVGVFPVDLQPSVQKVARGANGQLSGEQGQVLLVPIPPRGGPTELTGRFNGRHIPFFREPGLDGHGGHIGLVGIDMQDPPGTHELAVEVRTPRGSYHLSYNVLVVQKPFPVQKLRLPKHTVDLDPTTLLRVRAEQKEVRRVLGLVSDERFWAGRFIEPVQGEVAGAFGRKRLINGQPRSPHSGEDISAPMGAEVVATNDGVVRAVVHHFFSGKGVFLDHGVGLHSMYFHLSETLVEKGQLVRRGQVIGKVGASGRATGPHLHWGIRLNGARVDPYSLVKLPLDGAAPSTIP